MVNEGQGQPHSVLKLLQDIFSRKATGETFFFTNDLRVLVEVLVRELGDREHGDYQRTDYVQVLGGLLRTSMYFEDRHREADVIKCLTALRSEDNYDHDRSTEEVKRLAGELLDTFFAS